MPLNIDWQQILLHLFNFVILFAVLYFLLYAPVKKFMENRTEYYKILDSEAESRLAAAAKLEEERRHMLSAVDNEISEEKARACTELEASLSAMKKRAEDEVAKLISDARAASLKEREKMLREARSEIADLVSSAAEKIVCCEDSSAAFDQFLAEVQRGEYDE